MNCNFWHELSQLLINGFMKWPCNECAFYSYAIFMVPSISKVQSNQLLYSFLNRFRLPLFDSSIEKFGGNSWKWHFQAYIVMQRKNQRHCNWSHANYAWSYYNWNKNPLHFWTSNSKMQRKKMRRHSIAKATKINKRINGCNGNDT